MEHSEAAIAIKGHPGNRLFWASNRLFHPSNRFFRANGCCWRKIRWCRLRKVAKKTPYPVKDSVVWCDLFTSFYNTIIIYIKEPVFGHQIQQHASDCWKSSRITILPLGDHNIHLRGGKCSALWTKDKLLKFSTFSEISTLKDPDYWYWSIYTD